LVAANELVKKIANEEAVDKSRIYITGLSMGGMGTFESVYRYPDLYAAALPICGGADTEAYDKRVRKTAFWVFHGADDAVVDVKLSRDMVAKLKSLKAKHKYTEYPGVNHNSWDNAFADPEYLKWMFEQRKR
jgi:predicted peptidase